MSYTPTNWQSGDIITSAKLNKMEQGIANGSGGSSTLSGLTDVDISNPTDGQTLMYNATSGKWENGSGGSSGGGVLALHVDTQTGALDKTWQEIYDQINAGTICVVFQPISNDGITGLESLMVTSVEDQTQVAWGNGYVVICSGGFSLSAQTPNDYPIIN